MAVSKRIPHLTLVPGGLTEPIEAIEAVDLPADINPGSLIELSGTFQTEWLIQFLNLHPEFRTFWAERDSHISTTALYKRGLDLTKVTFGTLGQNLISPLSRVLQSQLYQVVIAPRKSVKGRIRQSLQIFTEKSNCILFLTGAPGS